MSFFNEKGMKIIKQTVLKDLLYNDAIKALNGLQSNINVLKKTQIDRNKKANNIPLTNKYLERSGLDLSLFEKQIPVIHVSGTKGKGSTCALCESVIRSNGYKTGLFTSPHIINVKERIKINGLPLTSPEFTNHFWSLYDLLDNNKDDEHDMPSYFKFLTVMAFHVFLKEKVDVAIFEVGIGGELDCTNVFKETPIVGITSLGLDHTAILGKTIEEIAWQKGGIMKNKTKAFTISDHSPSALKVLQNRAKEKNCSLTLVPPFQDHCELNKLGPIQTLNAPLAIQLAHAFIKLKNNISYTKLPILDVDEKTENAIKNCSFNGRFEIVQRGSCIYYLDGAHTRESAEYCSSWFLSHSIPDSKKILVFNLTGNRDASKLLLPFTKCGFHRVVFTPNNVNSSQGTSPGDLFDLSAALTNVQDYLSQYRNIWIEMTKCDPFNVAISSSVSETIKSIENNEKNQILVTGSLHLVGSVLTYFLNRGET